MIEKWLDIPGYKGLYQVSNLGSIKSLGRVTRDGRLLKSRILKLTLDKDGYHTVSLYSKDSTVKNCKQHRLVAQAFLENPYNKDHVNHKNGIKTDNNQLNLEWATCEENNKHQLDTGLKTTKHVAVYKNNILVTILQGKQDQVSFGLDPSSVSKCLTGKRNSHKGYTFKRIEEVNND